MKILSILLLSFLLSSCSQGRPSQNEIEKAITVYLKENMPKFIFEDKWSSGYALLKNLDAVEVKEWGDCDQEKGVCFAKVLASGDARYNNNNSVNNFKKDFNFNSLLKLMFIKDEFGGWHTRIFFNGKYRKS